MGGCALPSKDIHHALHWLLLLTRYVPNVAKRSIWDQCKKYYARQYSTVRFCAVSEGDDDDDGIMYILTTDDRPLNFENFKLPYGPYLRKGSSDPLHVWFYGGVFGVGGSNSAISRVNKFNRYVGENNARGVIKLVTIYLDIEHNFVCSIACINYHLSGCFWCNKRWRRLTIKGRRTHATESHLFVRLATIRSSLDEACWANDSDSWLYRNTSSRLYRSVNHTLTIRNVQVENVHDAVSSRQRWKWVIFCDPWPMWPITQLTHDPHDPRPMVITPTHGTRRGRGVAWWYWTTLSVLTAKNIVD